MQRDNFVQLPHPFIRKGVSFTLSPESGTALLSGQPFHEVSWYMKGSSRKKESFLDKGVFHLAVWVDSLSSIRPVKIKYSIRVDSYKMTRIGDTRCYTGHVQYAFKQSYDRWGRNRWGYITVITPYSTQDQTDVSRMYTIST